MNDRERRLRERIDELTDQRDQARQRAALIPALRNRIYKLEKMAALWRLRARQERAKR
jgi:hypothetical protein